MSRLDTAEVTKVRDLVLQVSRDRSISDDAAADARNTFRSICKEASKYGLTTADVVRAVFRPALEGQTVGCNCVTCRSRRDRPAPEQLLPLDDLVDPSPAS